MDQETCKVVYLDRRARHDQTWTSHMPPAPLGSPGFGHAPKSPEDEVEQNVRSLLSVFPEVTVYRSSSPCITELDACCNDPDSSHSIIMIIDIPTGEEPQTRQIRREVTPSTSPLTSRRPSTISSLHEEAEAYGMDFLQDLSNLVRDEHYASRIIPVAVLSGTAHRKMDLVDPIPHAQHTPSVFSTSPRRYYQAGAVDVVISPFSAERIHGLPAHAHRLDLERSRRRSSLYLPALSRRTSWVGTGEDKPYTLMKDYMVSRLMDHIIDPDLKDAPLDPSALQIDDAQHHRIAAAFGSWSFSAHAFDEDELVYGAYLMLEHALSMPELEKWRMSKDELLIYLLATRRVYSSMVLYHNFRHACDVLQATFCFLLATEAIPPFPVGSHPPPSHLTPLGLLIDPFHALVLLISAIGHDVGHPGVNNGFLVRVRAPLAQLYNDRSVLESFHCAAYSQILRRYWKTAFDDCRIRSLMIKTILATDMGMHTEYMMQMEGLQTKLAQNPRNPTDWDDKDQQNARELLLCLLIKCADICNVARKFDVASTWAKILIDEFFAQGQIEKDLEVETSLFGGPPNPDSLLEKCHSQIGFMNVFGYPLFGGISKLLPALGFVVEEININKKIWDDTLQIEKGQGVQQQRPNGTAAGAHVSVDALTGEGKVNVTHLEDVSTSPRVSLQLTESMNARAALLNSRRASGGTATMFDFSPPKYEHEVRRSSLGPTVLPDHLRTKRRTSVVHFN